MPGRVVLGDAEADRAEAVLTRAVEQTAQKLVAVAAAPAARDDRDRELRRLLVDEAEARVLPREQPIPGGADRHELVEDDQRTVAGAAPAVDVAGQRGLLVPHRRPPVEGVAEHVAEERDVARAAGSDHRREFTAAGARAHGRPTSARSRPGGAGTRERAARWPVAADRRDRKSTRLNSSHVEISYAVFCLKKKKKIQIVNLTKQKNDNTHTDLR